MPVRRSLLALLLCAAAVRADEGTGLKVEMRTLKGEVIRGELVSVTPAEVTVAAPDGKNAVPTAQVLSVDVEQADKPAPPEKFLDVELTDGSIFHCAACELKGKEARLTLVTGQEITVPLIKVSNLIKEAQDPKRRKEWSKELSRKRDGDVLAKLNKETGALNVLDGKLGSVSEDGKSVQFTIEDVSSNVALESVQGLIFDRAADPKMPLAICKLVDVFGTAVMVTEVEFKNGEVAVTTPNGVKTAYPPRLLARFDYNRDKLRFLSEMEPLKQAVDAWEDFRKGPGLDVNLDGKPIKLGDVIYPRGLSLRATTELVYDLRGDYREFQALAGVDRTALAPGVKYAVKLVIECDGRERKALTLTPEDKEPFQALTLNVKDVQKLRILVTRDDAWKVNYNCHLTLADAKVMK
jgi:hypothetical protein